jgi:predicted nucleic acid-binding protein
MIFADTGAWMAWTVRTDQHHAAADDWLRRNHEPLLTTDYIVDETLTLLRARKQHRQAREWGRAAFAGNLARIYYLTADDIFAAWRVFEQFSDKEWSFTDCTSKVVMERLGITTAFAFDSHFHQFGTVNVVP